MTESEILPPQGAGFVRTLIGHGLLRGYAEHGSEKVVRVPSDSDLFAAYQLHMRRGLFAG